MTFSYNTALTASKDKVRLMIGDTNEDSVLLQDEEIDYFLTQNSSPTRAAVLCCRAISAKFARQADTTVESVSVNYSQKAQAYENMARNLEAQAATSGTIAGPSATGISVAAMQAANEDADRPKPQIAEGQFTNPPGYIEDSAV